MKGIDWTRWDCPVHHCTGADVVCYTKGAVRKRRVSDYINNRMGHQESNNIQIQRASEFDKISWSSTNITVLHTED